MNEKLENEMREEAAAWQQLYRSWLQLMDGADVAESLARWNGQLVEQARDAMEPAWQIPLRWLADMERFVETSVVSEPVQELVLEAVRSGKAGVESAQRYSAKWLQACSNMSAEMADYNRRWLEPAEAAGQAWQEAVDRTLRLNADLIRAWTERETAGAAGRGDGAGEARDTSMSAGTTAPAKAGQSRARKPAREQPEAGAPTVMVTPEA